MITAGDPDDKWSGQLVTGVQDGRKKMKLVQALLSEVLSKVGSAAQLREAIEACQKGDVQVAFKMKAMVVKRDVGAYVEENKFKEAIDSLTLSSDGSLSWLKRSHTNPPVDMKPFAISLFLDKFVHVPR
jgi:hypothetical protein